MDASSPVLEPQSAVAMGTYDAPYRFGRQPTSRAPFPFTEREFARLLVVRARFRELGCSHEQVAA
jgi:hypothetical protein